MTDSPACSSCGSTAPQEELVPYARRFGSTSCGLIQWYTRKE
ncbi:hypothetical protein [Streptomyces himastatinicus]|nr:hypothetical protein [Streptomyces himastatinicus]